MKRTLTALLLSLCLVAGLLPARATAFSDRWGQLTPIGDDSALLDIAYGSGTWVAVGKLGTVVTSKDGTAWLAQDSGTEEDLVAVAFGNSRFLAVGKQPVVSENGTDWRPVTVAKAGKLVAVIFAAGKFTAADDKGQVFDSTDGTTWTLVKSFTASGPFAPPPAFVSLTYGSGLYTLIDAGGREWTYGARQSQPVGGWGTCARVLHLNGQYLMLCEGFVVTGPSDGRRLERREVNTWALLRDAAHDGRRYLAVGESGLVVTSTDGVTWTVQDKPRQAPDYYAVEYANGLFVLAGDDGRLWTSRDGAAWTLRYSGVLVDLAAVTGAEGRWAAVGADGAVFSSPAPWPWRWTRRASGTAQPLRAVTTGAGLFVATGDNGAVTISEDGKTWRPQSTGTTASLQAVVHDGARFVAAGTDASGKAVIATSVDGKAWSTKLVDVPGVRGLAYGQGSLVAVGAGGLVATSADGTAWTRVDSPARADLNAVAFGSGRFLAVGGTAGTGVVLTSTDGLVWSKVEGAGVQPLWGVTFAAGRFFLTGSEGAAGYFAEGIGLQITPGSISGEMRAIALLKNHLVAVGTGGAIRSWQVASGERSTVKATAGQVKVGEEVTVTAVLMDPDGRASREHKLTLRQEPALTTIVSAADRTDSDGQATFQVRAVQAGTVKLTVAADDGTLLGQPVTLVIESSCGKRFADVPSQHPACGAIEQLAEQRVLTGFADGFRPDQGLTRAELATMLVRALKLVPAPAERIAFTDVEGHWAASGGFLQAAVKVGAFGGMPDGTFRPNDPVTRAQLVKVVAAAAGLKAEGVPAYSDVKAGDWYAGWVHSARQAKLIGPEAAYRVYAEAAFQGDKPATRAEAAAMLANLLGK